MAKQTGLGDNFYVGAYDLSGDTGSMQAIGQSRAVIDVSPISKAGFERILGRADGNIAFNAFYNPSAGQSAAVLQTVATTAGTAETFATYAHGSAVGADAASLRGKQVDYAVTVGADLAIGLAVNVQAAAGAPVEWGFLLTAGKQTFASSGTVPATVDGGAATSFGASAYLHAFSVGSGTATIAVQDSADNVSFSDVSGLVFTVTAAGAQRLATGATATVRRYRRVNPTGTFTNAQVALSLSAYTTSQT